MDLQLPPARPEDKASWRRELRATRRSVVAEQGRRGRARQGQQLSAALLRWLEPYAAGRGRPDLSGWSVTAFAAMATEPPTEHLLSTLGDLGVQVWLPVTLPEAALGWRLAGDPAYDAAGHDPMHPDAAAVALSRGPEVLQDVDLALIPALAVSRDGRRLGQGGGYYDRVLPTLRQRASMVPVIAVLHDHEWLPAVPSEPHDALVDAVLTTAGVRAVEGLTAPE